MSKLLLIGIDSLDPKLLMRFSADLPNLSWLRRVSPEVRMRSIFPVDSIPAWISIYTGVTPAKHGLLYSFDVFDTSWKSILGAGSDTFRDRTLWDYAGKAGKRVCVLFPMMTFPPWPVNGIMVGRAVKERALPGRPAWMVERELRTYPPEVAEQCDLPPFLPGLAGKPPGFKKLGDFAEYAQECTYRDAQLALKMSQRYEWDIFFFMLWWADILQHFFWRYFDETDPTYPGPTPYKDVILEHYRLLDRIVGEFLSAHPGVRTVVLSDHGHGIRPPKTVNINEVLRRKGLLVTRGKASNPVPAVMERSKRVLLDITHRLELDYWLVKLAKTRVFSRWSKDIYMSTANIDMERTLAYLSSFAGPKSYAHGGIEVKKENLGDIEYNELLDSIISDLSELRHPDTGEKLVDWICRREELYHGPLLNLYPDIVFELKEGYGVNWSLHTPLIGTAYEHNLSSGGHKKDAVFLVSKSDDVECLRQDATLMDVAPTVLELLGVRGDFEFDGKSIFRKL
ncbi:MAG: alkaline phosphatase family protein [Chloroflexota bacterium]